jgi:hypothetical protein
MANIVALSKPQILKVAPAVYAERPAGHTSPDYHFVNTGELVENMVSRGWEVIAAKQQKVQAKHSHRKESAKHEVLLRLRDWPVGLEQLGGLYPTIRLINSHDWSSVLQLIIGMMRLVCGNGLTVAGAQFGNVIVRHDNAVEDLLAILMRMQEHGHKMMEIAQLWDSIELDTLQLLDFSTKAAEIRFGSDYTESHARALLIPQRSADKENTLWRVFNRVQENALKGGIKPEGGKRTLKAITNIQTSHDINSGLFVLASEFAPK